MKAVVLLLALAVSAYGHVVPLVVAPSGPITQISHVPAAAIISHAPIIAAPHAAIVAPHTVISHHGVVAHHAVVAAPAAIVAGPAVYTAANRGIVHQAPLPGHAISQTSLNLAPAPGTA